MRVRNFSVFNTPLGHQFSQNVDVQSIQSPTHSQAVVVAIKLRAFFVKGGDLGFFPASRNTFLTQSNMKEVGQVRNNHIFISHYLGKRTSKKELRILQSQVKKRQSSGQLPKNMETTRHVITARLGQSKASAVLLIPCEIRPRSKGTAEARASMCYVDVCIARSIVMASVGLPFLARFHWYRSLGVTHRGNSWMTLRSWVRTMVVAKRQFSDPVIFDKLGCKVFVWSIAMAPLAS